MTQSKILPKKEGALSSSNVSPIAIEALLGIVIGSVLMCLHMIPSLSFWMTPGMMAVFSTPLILYIGWRIFKKAFHAAFQIQPAPSSRIVMDTQFTLSVFAALFISYLDLFFPGLMIGCYFPECLLILGFRLLGMWVEDWGRNKILSSYHFSKELPHEVEVHTGRGWKKTPIYEVKKGDKIRVQHNEKVPCDGILSSNLVEIIQSHVDGQIKPVSKDRGAEILQGTRLLTHSSIEMVVTAPWNDSTQARQQRELEAVSKQNMQIAEKAKGWHVYFVKAVLLISLGGGALVFFYQYGYLHASFLKALFSGVMTFSSMLVIFCPCVLGCVIPIQSKVAMYRAREIGATIKNPSAIDNLANGTTLITDQNGTLTCAQFEVEEIKWLDNSKTSIETYLKIAFVLEQNSSHPIARSLCQYIEKQKGWKEDQVESFKTEYNIRNIEYEPGKGMKGNFTNCHGDEKKLFIGNETALNLPDSSSSDNKKATKEVGRLVFYIVLGGHIIGKIFLKEPLRPYATEFVNYFQGEHIPVVVCTGAPESQSLPYAKALGIPPEQLKAGCKNGNEKKELVKKLQEKKGETVIYLGDGDNDALALQAASEGGGVGVAVKTSPVAGETAQNHASVQLEGNPLPTLVNLHAICRQTMRMIKFSLVFTFVYNFFAAALMIFGVGFQGGSGIINPALGAVIMVSQEIVILSLAAILRLLPIPYPTQSLKEEYLLSHVSALPPPPSPASSSSWTPTHPLKMGRAGREGSPPLYSLRLTDLKSE